MSAVFQFRKFHQSKVWNMFQKTALFLLVQTLMVLLSLHFSPFFRRKRDEVPPVIQHCFPCEPTWMALNRYPSYNILTDFFSPSVSQMKGFKKSRVFWSFLDGIKCSYQQKGSVAVVSSILIWAGFIVLMWL